MAGVVKLYAAYKSGYLGSNILDTYFSFMANMISEEHLTVVEDDVIADKFKTRYNMELPLPFIRQILGVGIQNGSFVEDHGKYSVVVNELAKYRFSETDFNKLWNQLINEFATYCRTQDIDISSLDISAFVAGILDDTDEKILSGEKVNEQDGMASSEYGWYSFIKEQGELKTELYSFGQDSNPKIAATAYIVKMLAEVRALREGIIIADQLPTAMAPEVIKNTNIKLIHRLTSIDDRQLIGSTMSASGIQLEHVAVYRPGEALMSYEGLQRPFELRIQEQKGHGSETPNDDELYDIMLHKPAFFQLAQKEENLKLETLKENVKSLKKKEVEALCALSEYDSSVHTSTQITDFYWHMENIYTSIVILRSQYRRDCQAINELFISAERKAMLDELIRSIGESLQQKIKNNVVFLDSNGQLE